MSTMPPMSFEPPPPALQVKLLSPSAKTPTRGSPHAAGYDLYAAKEATVPRRGKVLVDLDISIAVPAGTYGRIAPRSGLASKHSIDTGAGVIDADYRGPVKVLLFNFSDDDFVVAVGERVAQLIVERVSNYLRLFADARSLSLTSGRFTLQKLLSLSSSMRQSAALVDSVLLEGSAAPCLA
jgi:dUTP pyrophosphatase